MITSISEAIQLFNSEFQRNSQVKELYTKIEAIIYKDRSEWPCSQNEKNALSNEDIDEINRLFDNEILGFKGEALKKQFFNHYFFRSNGSASNWDEITIFPQLCSCAHITALEYALPYIENIDAPTQKFKWSPLMMAMMDAFMTDSFEKMELLIDYGANVQYVSPESFLSLPLLCVLIKAEWPEKCEKMYAFLVQHGARIISPTFLKAVEAFEDPQSRDTKLWGLRTTLTARFNLEPDHLAQFGREVKEKAAEELREKLYMCLNNGEYLKLFKAVEDLQSAGPKAAEVVNFEFKKGGTPFIYACTLFKGMIVEYEEDEALLKDVCNHVLKALVDCGAEFHEDCAAYQIFDSVDPSLQNKLKGYCQTLIEHVMLREKALTQKAFAEAFV
ncbi:hypothetical protein CAGGBEG34_210021 [Candidatus Glomeribacter gigasporarum BEG34]|uniref:Uncharacterized protein n=1 Tax=Candidatus Glomeribacter gigasporarum BEG34 TaxID=1070319 RepID=G2J8R3_9BURK|nr:hypothetical protein [Candidatus Glomeribacter gigasporarum]CCD29160.1 hypothetical protein CAGGBEG34_210021 [Candidatus Glomeribacter gigasporarum BEG34]